MTNDFTYWDIMNFIGDLKTWIPEKPSKKNETKTLILT